MDRCLYHGSDVGWVSDSCLSGIAQGASQINGREFSPDDTPASEGSCLHFIEEYIYMVEEFFLFSST